MLPTSRLEIAFVAALAVLGAMPAAAAAPGARTTGVIAGRVIDEHTRLPVAGAVVTCVGSGTKHVVRTTALGTFWVRTAPWNAYIVDAQAPGYWKADLAEIKVKRGETTSVTVRMYAKLPGEK